MAKKTKKSEVDNRQRPRGEEKFLEELAPAIPKPIPVPIPVMSFDRYFSHTGKPAHHKAGMLVYLSGRATRGKRTEAEWNILFEKY